MPSARRHRADGPDCLVMSISSSSSRPNVSEPIRDPPSVRLTISHIPAARAFSMYRGVVVSANQTYVLIPTALSLAMFDTPHTVRAPHADREVGSRRRERVREPAVVAEPSVDLLEPRRARLRCSRTRRPRRAARAQRLVVSRRRRNGEGPADAHECEHSDHRAQHRDSGSPSTRFPVRPLSLAESPQAAAPYQRPGTAAGRTDAPAACGHDRRQALAQAAARAAVDAVDVDGVSVREGVREASRS